jgi:hypothetical protein
MTAALPTGGSGDPVGVASPSGAMAALLAAAGPAATPLWPSRMLRGASVSLSDAFGVHATPGSSRPHPARRHPAPLLPRARLAFRGAGCNERFLAADCDPYALQRVEQDAPSRESRAELSGVLRWGIFVWHGAIQVAGSQSVFPAYGREACLLMDSPGQQGGPAGYPPWRWFVIAA